MASKFEKLKAEFDETKYVSMTAEYKRSIKAIHKQTFDLSVEEVFARICQIFFKNDPDSLFFGLEVEFDKCPAYVDDYEKNQLISVLYKKDQSFHFYHFEIKPLRNKLVELKYTQGNKMNHTITGYNGYLGTWKYKRQTRGKALLVFKTIKEFKSQSTTQSSQAQKPS